MNLHQLELFCAVVDNGSFSLASRQLFMSQPALSIQVKRLERGLGLELIHRSRNGIAVTPAGREVYRLARAMLEQARDAELRLDALKGGDAGSLALGVSPTGALHFLGNAVRAFRREYPGANVRIEVEMPPRAFERLSHGGLDAVLAWGPRLPTSFRSTVLGTERFGIIASSDHPRATPGVVTRQEFLRTPLIVLQYMHDSPGFVYRWLMKHDLLPMRVAREPSIDTIKQLVELDGSFAILSRSSVERDLQSGHLTWLEMPELQLERPMVLLRPAERCPPLLERFVASSRRAPLG